VGVLGVPVRDGNATRLESATFTVAGSMNSLCPQACSQHGACEKNQCVCQAGYVG
jgi:hypothetical protein